VCPEVPSADQELEPLPEPLKQTDVLRAKNRDVSLHPVEFEKDNDSHGHIDFVASAASCKIARVTKLQIRWLAGKIISVITTMTGMVWGFVCLEM
jgi:hypothetical protein